MQEVVIHTTPNRMKLHDYANNSQISVNNDDLVRSPSTNAVSKQQITQSNNQIKIANSNQNSILNKFLRANERKTSPERSPIQNNMQRSQSPEYRPSSSPIINQFQLKSQYKENQQMVRIMRNLMFKFEQLQLKSHVSLKIGKLLHFKKFQHKIAQKLTIQPEQKTFQQTNSHNITKNDLNSPNTSYQPRIANQEHQIINEQYEQEQKLRQYEKELLNKIELKKRLLLEQNQSIFQTNALDSKQKELNELQIQQFHNLNNMMKNQSNDQMFEFQKTLQTMQQIALINNTKQNLQQQLFQTKKDKKISAKKRQKMSLQQQKELDDYEVEAHKIILQKTKSDKEKQVNKLTKKNKENLKNCETSIQVEFNNNEQVIEETSSQTQDSASLEQCSDDSSSSSLQDVKEIQPMQTQFIQIQDFKETTVNNKNWQIIKTNNALKLENQDNADDDLVQNLTIQQKCYVFPKEIQAKSDFQEIKVNQIDIIRKENIIESSNNSQQNFRYNEIMAHQPFDCQRIDNNTSYESNDGIIEIKNNQFQKDIIKTKQNDISLSMIQQSPIQNNYQELRVEPEKGNDDVLMSSQLVENIRVYRQQEPHYASNVVLKQVKQQSARQQVENDVIIIRQKNNIENVNKNYESIIQIEKQHDRDYSIQSNNEIDQVQELRQKRHFAKPTSRDYEVQLIEATQSQDKQVNEQNRQFNEVFQNHDDENLIQTSPKQQYEQQIDKILNSFGQITEQQNQSLQQTQQKKPKITEPKLQQKPKNQTQETFLSEQRAKRQVQTLNTNDYSDKLFSNKIMENQILNQPIQLSTAQKALTTQQQVQQNDEQKQKRALNAKSYQQLQLERLLQLKEREEQLDQQLQKVKINQQAQFDQNEFHQNIEQLNQNIIQKQQQLYKNVHQKVEIASVMPLQQALLQNQQQLSQQKTEYNRVPLKNEQNDTIYNDLLRNRQQQVENDPIRQREKRIPQPSPPQPFQQNPNIQVEIIDGAYAQPLSNMDLTVQEGGLSFIQKLKQGKQQLLQQFQNQPPKDIHLQQQVQVIRPNSIKPKPKDEIQSQQIQQQAQHVLQPQTAVDLTGVQIISQNKQQIIENQKILYEQQKEGIFQIDGFVRQKNTQLLNKAKEQRDKRREADEADLLINQLRPQKLMKTVQNQSNKGDRQQQYTMEGGSVVVPSEQTDECIEVIGDANQ